MSNRPENEPFDDQNLEHVEGQEYDWDDFDFCKDCDGEGWIGDKVCRICKGTGGKKI